MIENICYLTPNGSWAPVSHSIHVKINKLIPLFVFAQYLPIYTPSEDEKRDPALFASNVRRIMAKSVSTSISLMIRQLQVLNAWRCRWGLIFIFYALGFSSEHCKYRLWTTPLKTVSSLWWKVRCVYLATRACWSSPDWCVNWGECPYQDFSTLHVE